MAELLRRRVARGCDATNLIYRYRGALVGSCGTPSDHRQLGWPNLLNLDEKLHQLQVRHLMIPPVRALTPGIR